MSQSGKNEITPQNLRDLAVKIDGLIGEYKLLYEKDLYTAWFADLDNAWKGKDQQAYKGKVESYKQGFLKLENELTAYSEHLKKTAASFEGTVNIVAGIVNKIGSQGGN